MSAAADLVGLGMTAMSLRPGTTPLELAVKASAAALADAGLERADIDGILVGSSQGFGRNDWASASPPRPASRICACWSTSRSRAPRPSP